MRFSNKAELVRKAELVLGEKRFLWVVLVIHSGERDNSFQYIELSGTVYCMPQEFFLVY